MEASTLLFAYLGLVVVAVGAILMMFVFDSVVPVVIVAVLIFATMVITIYQDDIPALRQTPPAEAHALADSPAPS